MCGRFTLHSRLNLLLQQFAIEAGPELAPRYNIAPTQLVPVVRLQTDVAGSDDESDDAARELVPLRWGLVPSWANDLSIGNRMINARAETVAEKPSFRAAFKRRRCLIPADGYYEWRKTEQGKQPFYIHRRDQTLLAMAGLWERWHGGQADMVDSFTIITTDANDDTSSVHDRMPVFLDPEAYAMWLDPEFQDRDQLQALLVPYGSGELELTPVSKLVNSPRHESPDCIEPLP
jgi:putative SOS response-associated peptidase YedK